jgi:GT2 family glycosyltransferase
MTLPRVAICVVTYNSADLIEELVQSLPDGAAGTEWTLVVADNDSHDGTVDAVRRFAPDARVVETGANLGYAGGVNAAIQAAGEQDAYLVLNADVRLTHGCIATLFESLSPTVGIAVPKLLDAKGETIWSMRREPTVRRAWADAVMGAERAGRVGTLGEIVSDPALYEAARFTDWAEGSTQLVSRECQDACGPWDGSYFLYSEETEFDLRARDRGYATLYQPAAVAVHLEGGSAGSPRQWSLLVANRVLLFSRRNGRIRTGAFWLATVLRESTRAVLGKPTSRAAVRDLVSRRRMSEHRGPDWLAGVRL